MHEKHASAPMRERLRPWRVASIALAGLGVVPMALSAGGLPWISLVLALTALRPQAYAR